MTTVRTALQFTAHDQNGERLLDVAIQNLVVAGWTGRDLASVEAHIVELEKLGVARPSTTPLFYRGSASLLTQAHEIEVVGGNSSGEVEPVIIYAADALWLGLGSDHTDRDMETRSVALSKQLCAKPICKALWRLEDISGHWDQLVVRSWASRSGERRLYQEGALRNMRHPADLMELYARGGWKLSQGTAMFCGTVPVTGEIAPADFFEMEIEDPVLKRKILHNYRPIELPIVG